MSESKESKTETRATAPQAVERPPMTWRQALLGCGMFTLVVTLFVAGMLKESGGVVTKVLGVIGLTMMAAGIVGIIVDAISPKTKRGK